MISEGIEINDLLKFSRYKKQNLTMIPYVKCDIFSLNINCEDHLSKFNVFTETIQFDKLKVHPKSKFLYLSESVSQKKL